MEIENVGFLANELGMEVVCAIRIAALEVFSIATAYLKSYLKKTFSPFEC